MSYWLNTYKDDCELDFWKIENGRFYPKKYSFNPNDEHQNIADSIADNLIKINGIKSVYLRGSVLESKKVELRRDIDIIVFFNSNEITDKIERDVMSIKDKYLLMTNLHIDLVLVSVCDFIFFKKNSLLKIIIINRSLLLRGEPVFNLDESVDINEALLDNLLKSHIKNFEHQLWHLTSLGYANEHKYTSWFQKSALRFGAILSLKQFGLYSRDPYTCTYLIRNIFYELTNLSQDVFISYCKNSLTNNACEKAVTLFAELQERSNLGN